MESPTAMRKNFTVTKPPHDPRWLLALMLAIPMLIALMIAITVGVHAHGRVMLVIVAANTTIFLILGVFLGWAAQRRTIALGDGVLEVLATFYRRRVPVQDIDLAKARVLNLRERSEWRPWLRTNGFGLPYLRAGWFRSRNWTSLFCLITDRQRVVLLPLHAGGALLLSAERPTELLDALRGG